MDFNDIYFSDKVKFLGTDSCLYQIPKNDLVDDMKPWPSVTFPDVYCYLIATPGDFTGKKPKAYNFVISGWVKPLQVLKRNSGYEYDSHDATSPSSFLLRRQECLWTPWLPLIRRLTRRTQDFTMEGVHVVHVPGSLGDVAPVGCRGKAPVGILGDDRVPRG